MLTGADPADRARSAARRLAGPMESLAQGAAQRVLDLVLEALDPDAMLGRIDLDALLERVDLDTLLDRVDVNRILDRVDLDRLTARSSASIASEAIDVARSQAVGLDEFIARLAGRLLRRRHAAPPGPPRLLSPQARQSSPQARQPSRQARQPSPQARQ